MVIPWIGFPLSALLKQVEPTSKAKYVAFESSTIRKSCWVHLRPASSSPTWKDCGWMRPCILSRCWRSVSTARRLPNQDGAPFRLVVPWKYGFKSIKSIVKIRLVEKEPLHHLDPVRIHPEYGFYSNVNPEGNHPFAGARARSGGSGSSGCATPPSSTATAIRWLIYTPGWIRFASITERHEQGPLQPLDQSVLVPAVPGSLASARYGAASTTSWEPTPSNTSRIRPGTGRCASCSLPLCVTPLRKTSEPAQAGAFPADAGAFRIFLRMPAPDHLGVAG